MVRVARFTSPIFAISVAMVLAGGSFVVAQVQTPSPGNDQQIRAAGLQISVFADGLNFPMGMIGLPDNSILVATSNPTGGSFFRSTGELLRLTDTDSDGIADDSGSVVATGLTGPLVAIQRAGDLVFVTTAAYREEGIYVLRRGDRWKSPMMLLGKIDVISPGSEHQTYGLAVRRTPGIPGSYDLLFNAGAYGNVDAGGNRVTLGGLASGFLEDASIYMLTVTDLGSDVTFSEPVKVAGQLRNASAFVFDRDSGDLIIGENGMDTPGNAIVSFSADEINVIPADDIGIVEYDFGFPDTYTAYESGESIGSDGVLPVVTFNSVDGSESEGIAALVQIPESFPAPFGGGYAAGFHGQFDSFGDENEENPLVFFDLHSGNRFELISNDNPTIGHLDSLFSSDNAIYVADLCGTGLLAEANSCGVIYRVSTA